MVPFDERFTLKGIAPAVLSAVASTFGLRLPPLYSIRISAEFALPWNQAEPYSKR